MEGLLRLQELDVSNNQICSLQGLEGLQFLHIINLESNCVADQQETRHLQALSLLRNLDIRTNPIQVIIYNAVLVHFVCLSPASVYQSNPNIDNISTMCMKIQDGQEYRLHTIFNLQKLTKLDGEIVTIKEKVTAINKFGPPAEVVAAQDYITNKVFALLQPQKIY
uniref:Uncharacterized protein n=1 Tax=Eptatretus burgeri TaxID=7764 RepID=A0A8C4QIW2_EPTBU